MGILLISLGILAANMPKQCGDEMFVGNTKCWSIRCLWIISDSKAIKYVIKLCVN